MATYYERNAEKLKERARLRYQENREEIRAKQNANRQTDEGREAARAYHLGLKFGITPEIYESMLAAQSGTCAICKGEPTGRWKRFHVDHDHVTGAVRGLLCTQCNTGLGLFKDNALIMAAALTYISKKD